MDALHFGELEVIIEMVTQDDLVYDPLRRGARAYSTRDIRILLYMFILQGPVHAGRGYAIDGSYCQRHFFDGMLWPLCFCSDTTSCVPSRLLGNSSFSE